VPHRQEECFTTYHAVFSTLTRLLSQVAKKASLTLCPPRLEGVRIREAACAATRLIHYTPPPFDERIVTSKHPLVKLFGETPSFSQSTKCARCPWEAGRMPLRLCEKDVKIFFALTHMGLLIVTRGLIASMSLSRQRLGSNSTTTIAGLLSLQHVRKVGQWHSAVAHDRGQFVLQRRHGWCKQQKCHKM
jgi:hypothetical protein